MIIRYVLLGVASFALLAVAAVAQVEEVPQRIAPEALRADLDLAYAALQEGDAGLYRFTPKAEMDRAFAHARARIDRPLTSLEFYRILAPATASVRNGHTSLSAPAEAWTAIRARPQLPLGVRVIDNRAFVLRDFSDASPSLVGAELLTVNGRPIGEIMARINESTLMDGRVAAGRDRNVSGWGLIYNLPLIMDLHAPFRVTVRRAGETRSATLAGLTPALLTEAWRERFPADREASPERSAGLRFDDGVAIITIPHWDHAEEGQRSLIDDIRDWFAEIERQGPRALIIDIRNNSGGDETVATALFAHVARTPFNHYECIAVRATDFSFLRYTTNAQSHRDNLRNYTRPARGRCRSPAPLELTNRPNLGLQQVRAPHYAGPVIVLTDGGSFSTSAEFAALVRSHRRGTLIGEETSGSYYGSNSGIMIPVTLPGSGVELSIPTIAYWLAVRRNVPADRGVVPDVRVRSSLDDILAGRDPVMTEAMRRAARVRRR